MAEPPRQQENSNDVGATRVLNYVILDWLRRHMDFDCQDVDAVSSPSNPSQYPQGSPQLFQYWPMPEYRPSPSLPQPFKYAPVAPLHSCRLPPWPLLFQYGPQQQLHQYPHPPWPLHFQTVEMIEDRPYLLHLEKVPFAYLVHKFTVQCLGSSKVLSMSRGIIDFDDTVVLYFPHGVVREFYRAVCQVSEDYEYVVRLELTRFASRFNTV